MQPQNRLLTQCLGPTARELLRTRLVDRFWFDRFDARGPHVFSMLRVCRNPEEVRARLSERLAGHLAESPSGEDLSPEEVAARSEACRGKTQCAPDRLPGLAENNTWLVFEHDPEGYPFFLTSGLPAQEELWALMTDQALQGIDRIAEHPTSLPTGAAVQWLAELDRELQATGSQTAATWRYHATTLLPGLAERLAAGEAEVLSALPELIGSRNRKAFAHFWNESEDSTRGWNHLPRLADILAADFRPEPLRRRLLREIVHTTLKQLGVRVAHQIPLILFAWNRNLHGEGSASRASHIEPT